MKKHIELPIEKPIYGTYNHQCAGSAVVALNPSIRNWFLNEVFILQCNKLFLEYPEMSPGVTVIQSSWINNPHLDKLSYSMRFTKGYLNPIIRELIDNGYYAVYNCVDDYYIEGKSGYRQYHYSHDGMICGYDQEKKTYSIYAYDQNHQPNLFKTSQKGFTKGRLSMESQGIYGDIWGIKPFDVQVDLDIPLIRKKLIDYLNSSPDPSITENLDWYVFGINVHDCVALYVDKLIDGSVKCNDHRVFRMLWEHKKNMLERLITIEKTLKLDSGVSDNYSSLVELSDKIRLVHLLNMTKYRESAFPFIKSQLLLLKEQEQKILEEFLKKW